MSETLLVKGSCARCGGQLELPAPAAGSTIDCPHCGEPTELAAPAEITGGGGRKSFLIALLAIMLSAGLLVAFVFFRKPAEVVAPQIPTAVATLTAAPALPPDAVTTNDFAVASFALEKKPGGSLVYVTGKLRNLLARQRFGVRLEFALFDRDENQVGAAKDYLPVLEPGGVWSFKALVLESKAASAEFGSVREDR